MNSRLLALIITAVVALGSVVAAGCGGDVVIRTCVDTFTVGDDCEDTKDIVYEDPDEWIRNRPTCGPGVGKPCRVP